jgi:ABC-type multidrug transport system fused ATPase/permease subunit
MYSDVVESTICMSIARASGAPIASAKALAVVATISPIRLRPSSRDVDAADADVPRSPFARARVATRVVRRFVARAFARVVVVVVVLIVVVLIIIIIVAECRSFDRSIDPIDRSARPRRRSRTRQTGRARRESATRDGARGRTTRRARDATRRRRRARATRRDATRKRGGNEETVVDCIRLNSNEAPKDDAGRVPGDGENDADDVAGRARTTLVLRGVPEPAEKADEAGVLALFLRGVREDVVR